MSVNRRTWLAIGAASLALLGCRKEEQQSEGGKESPAAEQLPGAEEPVETKPPVVGETKEAPQAPAAARRPAAEGEKRIEPIEIISPSDERARRAVLEDTREQLHYLAAAIHELEGRVDILADELTAESRYLPSDEAAPFEARERILDSFRDRLDRAKKTRNRLSKAIDELGEATGADWQQAHREAMNSILLLKDELAELRKAVSTQEGSD